MTAHEFADRADEFLTKFRLLRRTSRLVSIAMLVLVPLWMVASQAGAVPGSWSLILVVGMAGGAYILWPQLRMRRWLSSRGLDCSACKRPLVYQDRAVLIASRACAYCHATALD